MSLGSLNECDNKIEQDNKSQIFFALYFLPYFLNSVLFYAAELTSSCCLSASSENPKVVSLFAGNQNISTPKYPLSYPASHYQVWKLVATKNRRVVLLFHTVDLENPVRVAWRYKCLADHIKMYYGDSVKATLLQTICGKTSNKLVVSNGQTMLVEFWSNEKIGGKSFLATVSNKTVNEGKYITIVNSIPLFCFLKL